jgi:cell division transport system permease protein
MSLYFSIREGMRGFSKARLASLLSLSSIALTIFLLGLLLSFNYNLNAIINNIRAKIDLEVFINIAASDNEIQQLQNQISREKGVAGIKFISRAQAAERYRVETGQDIYQILEYNPLPASFIITPIVEYRQSVMIEVLKRRLETFAQVDEVIYQKPFLVAIERYIQLGNIIMVSLSLVIIIIAIILIHNTIRLTIHARRNIIEIMRLVGATERFVRRPFLIEGIIQGMLGSLLAAGIVYYLLRAIKIFVYAKLQFNYELFLGLIIFGTLIGLFSAWLSVRKYLKDIY